MKKLIFVSMVAVTFCLTSNPVSAQISVELDFSYNSPGGDFGDIYDGGVGISIHPRFKIDDKIAVGLNVGGNAFLGGDFQDPTGSVTASVEAASVINVLGTIQYKVLDRNIGPYAELGLGVFSFKAGTVDAGSVVGGTIGTQDESFFGVAPKVGVMIGFFNIYGSYIAAGDLNYTQFGVGFRFGSK